jgi:hypothetical protein
MSAPKTISRGAASLKQLHTAGVPSGASAPRPGLLPFPSHKGRARLCARVYREPPGPAGKWILLLVLWRRCYEVSQPQAADEIRVPYKTLEKWEQGTMLPGPASVTKLRVAFRRAVK